MNAELYIKKQYLNKKTDLISFTDDYNDYSLFNFLRSNLNKEFSWWLFVDNKKWFDKKSNMTIAGAIEFKKTLLQAKEDLQKKNTFCLHLLDLDKLKTTKQIKYNFKKLTKKQVKYYLQRLYLLIDFLTIAIEHKSIITWNV